MKGLPRENKENCVHVIRGHFTTSISQNYFFLSLNPACFVHTLIKSRCYSTGERISTTQRNQGYAGRHSVIIPRVNVLLSRECISITLSHMRIVFEMICFLCRF